MLISHYNDFCVYLKICCAHNEMCKRVYYNNDRFFSHILCWKYDNVAIVFIQKRIYRQYIDYSVKNQDNYEMKVYFLNLTLIWKKTRGQKSQENGQVLLIRAEKCELCLWLDVILVSTSLKNERYITWVSCNLISSTIVSYFLQFWCCRRFVALLLVCLAIQTMTSRQ